MPVRSVDELLAVFHREGIRGLGMRVQRGPLGGAPAQRILDVLRQRVDERTLDAAELTELWEALVAMAPPPGSLVAFVAVLRHAHLLAKHPWRDAVSIIVDQLERLLADQRDPHLRALPTALRALTDLGLGRLGPCMRTLQGLFSVLPTTSSLRVDLLRDVGMRCALQGVLTDLRPLFTGASDGDGISPLLLYIDAVERGDLDAAAAQRRAAEARAQLHAPNIALLHCYAQYAEVIGQVRAGRPAQLARRGDAHPAMHRDLGLIVRLLNGDAPEVEEPLAKLMTSSLSIGMLPVFAALARGDRPTARMCLARHDEMRVKTASTELGWAILHHLEGDSGQAHERLEAALAAATHYGSIGLFDLCLRMVPGLSVGALMRHAVRNRRFLPATAMPLGVIASADQSDGAVLVGGSPAMQQVRAEIARAAAVADLPVLVVGETGTGKELAARAIHRQGPRAKQPFVALNCAAVADDLLFAELFGHARGAFTGSTGERGGLIAEAGKGTIFLDEIGDATPRFQASLLRLLETGEYRRLGDDRVRRADCGLIAATNVDLEAAVAEGRFRSDLLYRLERMVVALPPLRDRVEDIPDLLAAWLGDAVVDSDLLRHLARQPWRGNVRELRNACQRVALRSDGHARLDLATWQASNQERRRDSGSWRATGAQPRTREYAPSRALEWEGAETEVPRAGPLHGSERLAAMRALFRRRGRLTRVDVMRELGCAGSTATLDLRALCDEGLIEKVEPSRAPRSHYFRLRAGA